MIVRFFVFAVLTFSLSKAYASLECSDLPPIYQKFKNWHVLKLYSADALTNEAFFSGMERGFLKELDPNFVVFLERDVQDYLKKSEVSVSKLILENNNCNRFEEVYKRFQKAKERGLTELEAFLTQVDLFDKISKIEKSHSGLTIDQVLMQRKTILSGIARTASELEQNRLNYLAFEFIQNKIKLKNVSSDVEGDAFWASAKSLIRIVTGEDKTSVAEYMARSAFKAVDPHSNYFPSDVLKEFKEIQTSKFSGLGINFVDGGSGMYITEVIEGGSAEQSGALRVKDLVIKINNRPTAEMNLKDFSNNAIGPEGTEVTLELIRNGEMQKIKMKRTQTERIKNNIVTGLIDIDGKKLGYVKLLTFLFPDTNTFMRQKMQAMESQNNIDGWILDLRDNAGGRIDIACDVAGLFLGPNKDFAQVLDTKIPPPHTFPLFTNNLVSESFDQPMVVLTSRLSGSASELVASALQLQGRALVVSNSETTFRKGSIQIVDEYGVKGGIKITIGFFFNIHGEPIQKHGVAPDVLVPSAKKDVESFDETKVEHVLAEPANLPMPEESINLFKKARAPMQALLKKINYGSAFIESMADKDVVLEAGQRIVVDIINDEALSKIREEKRSKPNPSSILFPGFGGLLKQEQTKE